MDSLTELYCLIDDFCREFEPAWQRHLLATEKKRRQRPSLLSLAELMTLAILFHQLRYRQLCSSVGYETVKVLSKITQNSRKCVVSY
jgi:hypothetical protein